MPDFDIQNTETINEAISQNIIEANVQKITEDSMIEEVKQDNCKSSYGQLSLSEDNGEQVDEIDNVIENVEYQQMKIIEVENDEVFDTITQIRNWAIINNIQQKTLDELLAILRRKLLPGLPKSAKTFLHTQTARYNIREMKAADNSSGEFVYLGLVKGLKMCVREDLHKNNKILLQMNVDGIPLFKSSTKQFWPILCKVFFDPDIYEPFPVAIYSGDTKPMSVDEYLHDFVEEINELFAEGIIIKEHRFAR